MKSRKLGTLNGSRKFNGALNMLLAQAMFVISQQWQKRNTIRIEIGLELRKWP